MPQSPVLWDVDRQSTALKKVGALSFHVSSSRNACLSAVYLDCPCHCSFRVCFLAELSTHFEKPLGLNPQRIQTDCQKSRIKEIYYWMVECMLILENVLFLKKKKKRTKKYNKNSSYEKWFFTLKKQKPLSIPIFQLNWREENSQSRTNLAQCLAGGNGSININCIDCKGQMFQLSPEVVEWCLKE